MDKSFDCHMMQETVYYFCIRNGHNYTTAENIIKASPIQEVPDITKSKIVFDGDILFTSAIIKEIDQFQESESLLAYFRNNVSKFGYNHAGATDAIQKLWERIAPKDGLADLEKEKIQQLDIKEKAGRGVWEIFKQILGWDEVDEENRPLYVIHGDRSIKPLLKNNQLLPVVAEKNFPSRQTIEKIINGRHVKPESIRKTLILIYFYYFWICKAFKNQKDAASEAGEILPPTDAKLISRKNMTAYRANVKDDERFINNLNRQLLEAGYQELYLGNVYEGEVL